MGVKGLWRLLHPVARPIKLETLANRKLAVDASIWLHQFLRGMRDPDGNALANAHILGFYRRICKLLYYNIKPVFVYDGGTPNLKRLTLAERRRRRRNDTDMLKRTAEKLLATQLRLRELEKRRISKLQKKAAAAAAAAGQETETANDSTDNSKYIDELKGLMQAELTDKQKAALVRSVTGASQARVSKDRYVLPPMETDFETLARMRQGDLRLGINPEDIEHDEIQKFITDFKKEGGHANIDSEVFKALPSELQYEILSDIRIRSRVTSYERVQEMVRLANTPMDFSKLQVEGVIRRNEVTQKLLTVNQAVSKIEETTVNKPGRIASQRSREYILIKNEDGGWVLGGRATAGATKDKPLHIDSDEESPVKAEPLSQMLDVSDEDDDVEFEEVKVEAEGTPVTASVKPPKQTPLVDDFMAYADEDESVEQVMAKFAELEEGRGGGDEVLNAAVARRRETTPVRDTNRANEMQIGTPRKIRIMTEIDDVSSAALSPVSHESLDFGDFDETLDDTDISMFLGASPDHQQPFQRPQHGIVISDTPGTTPKTYRKRHRALSVSEEDQLDQQGYFTYWTAYVPLSFKERHPSHETMMHEAIFVWDDEQLEMERHSAERKLEKTNANDIESIECQRFWAEFLASLDRWRKAASVREAGVNVKMDSSVDALVTSASEQQRQQGKTHEDKHVSMPEATSPPSSSHIGLLDFSSSVLKRTLPADQPVAPTPVVAPVNDVAIDAQSNDSGVGSLVTSPEPGQAEKSIAEEREVQGENDFMEVDQEQWTKPVEVDVRDDQAMVDGSENILSEVAGDEDKTMATIEPEDEDDLDDLDEAHITDLANEEQDFTQLFPDMANLPGVTVIPKAEAQPPQDALEQLESAGRTAQELAALEEQEEAANLAEARRLQEELKNLQEQKRRHNRDADDLTEQMIAETQMLLRLFGIPYIVAPMEAEAQCADLQARGIVEGIVTEDSDVFLFGGKRIFKNMFREERYVECYLMNDIERDLGITRERLIQLAHLLGSDYTNGIKGVGAITAMEILRLFPSLKKFAKWWRGGKKDNGESDDDKAAEDSHESEDDDAGPKDEVALEKLAKLCQKLYVPKSFPSAEVTDAYLHPMVDDNDGGRFEWGIPDLDGLRDFLRHNMGWDRGEVDRVLLPIIRQMARVSMEGSQTTLDTFFDYSAGMGAFQRRQLNMSARLRKAVNGLVGDGNGDEENAEKDASKNGKDKRSNKKQAAAPKGANGKRTNSGRRVQAAKGGHGEDGPTSSSSDEEPDACVEASPKSTATTASISSESTTPKKRQKTSPTAQKDGGISIKGRKPTVVGRKRKDGAPAGVQAAKRNLASKGVDAKLAERRRLLAEAEQRQHTEESRISSVAKEGNGSADNHMASPTRPLASEGSSSGESSSGEDEDFVQDHWDRLDSPFQSSTKSPIRVGRPSVKKVTTTRRRGGRAALAP
ncbi:DNA repair protein rad2 [Actinomortierella wolfii]|nr:DNA repair protein rad2 [Actinomortierella wolfii]